MHREAEKKAAKFGLNVKKCIIYCLESMSEQELKSEWGFGVI